MELLAACAADIGASSKVCMMLTDGSTSAPPREVAGVGDKSSEDTLLPPAGGTDRGQDLAPGQKEDSLKTALYRTLRFQSFLREFQDPDVRAAFLAGHFVVEDSTEKMLECIDKILELILPSVRLEDDPWDSRSRTGVTFLTDMMDGAPGEPVDRDGKPLPIGMSFTEWMQYFGKLRKSPYWKTFSPSGGACSVGLEAPIKLDLRRDGMASIGKFYMQDRAIFQPPLRHSSPVKKPSAGVRAEFSEAHGDCDKGLHQLDPNMELFEMRDPPRRKYTAAKYPDRGTSSRRGPRRRQQESLLKLSPNNSGESNTAFLKESCDQDSVNQDRHRRKRAFRGRTFESYKRSYADQRRQPSDRRRKTDYRRETGESQGLTCNRDRHRSSDSSDSRSPTEDSGSSGSSDDYSNSDRDQDHHSMSWMLQRMHFSREVVAPVPFGGQDGGSLKRFLSDFERYFKQKYSGTDRQCSRLLGDFLAGPAKRAYEALGGTAGRYSKTKPKLLKWYESERINQRRTAEEAFDHSAMEDEESLTIYALRLERLARIAFPNTRREQERQLCRKFWKSAPRHFIDVMTGSEHSLALAGKRHLRWKDVKRLAEVEDRQTKRVKVESVEHAQEQQVWFSRSSKAREPVHYAVDVVQGSEPAIMSPPGRRAVRFEENQGTPGLPRRTAWRQRTAGNRGRSTFRGPSRDMCNWCGKSGHLEERCWLKKGCCVVCGSEDHARDGCPQGRAGKLGFTPTCSLCRGDHLGRDCPQHPLN